MGKGISLEDLRALYGYKEKQNNSFKIIEEKKTKYVENSPLKRKNYIEKPKQKPVSNGMINKNNYNNNKMPIFLFL